MPPPKSLWQVILSLPERHPILPFKTLFGYKRDPFVIPLTIFVAVVTLCGSYTIINSVFGFIVFWGVVFLSPYITLQCAQACGYLVYRCVRSIVSLLWTVVITIALAIYRPLRHCFTAMSRNIKKRHHVTPDEAKPGVSGLCYTTDDSDYDRYELTYDYDEVPFLQRFSPDDLTTTFRRRRTFFSSDESE